MLVVILCFLTIVADGYDLIIYGATVPSLMEEPGWGMTPAMAGMVGGWTLAGLMVGFLLTGWLTDRLGRRNLIMIGVLWFSIGSALCALAESPQILGVCRFLSGIGLGGVVPCAVALTIEYAPRGRRQWYNGLMLTGYSVGGILSALAALAMLPEHSWRVLYALGGLYIVVLPVMYFLLPESVNYLAGRGRLEEGRKLAQQYGIDFEQILEEQATHQTVRHVTRGRVGYHLLFSPAFRGVAALFIFGMFCTQLIIYGLNTWLPQLMRHAGYPLGSSLQFLLVLQLGAVVGTLGGSMLADRLGSKRVVVPYFLIGSLSLLVLSQKPDAFWLMCAVFGAGLGTIGSSTLLYGFLAAYFPSSCRGAAVGAALGIGRAGAILGPMIGGWIVGANLDHHWNFYAFALPAVLAAMFVALIPSQRMWQR
ncbi:aromatic acid/H+ symport family MFS transporter [Pseudomonas sp. PNP]|uniref:MFS transporter n=1 Tax=Pseudomonas sp. PNP TaxID=361819 RepID=UPI001AECFA18|nr:aromatic acid/H+ symport family MFS transporter [Pseudomonas sp. PNP]MBP2839287.1 aromatic acid/H+ symport family MFS transporter [Pseudomonas sp. PNP]